MNLLQSFHLAVIEHYTVGVAWSLCRRLLLDMVIVNMSIVMALSTTCTQCSPEANEFVKIKQNKDYYVVHGHSRSSMVYERNRHTTDGRAIAYSERER